MYKGLLAAKNTHATSKMACLIRMLHLSLARQNSTLQSICINRVPIPCRCTLNHQQQPAGQSIICTITARLVRALLGMVDT